jgi:hypothetical protein
MAMSDPAPSSTPSAPSPAANASPATVATATETPLSQTDSSSSGEYERRRRRRRRKRQVKTESNERRTRIFLGVIVVLLVLVALTGGELRKLASGAKAFVMSHIPIAALKSAFRLEVLALIAAALVLLYLMPGVEDKVLKTLGLRDDRKRR